MGERTASTYSFVWCLSAVTKNPFEYLEVRFKQFAGFVYVLQQVKDAWMLAHPNFLFVSFVSLLTTTPGISWHRCHQPMSSDQIDAIVFQTFFVIQGHFMALVSCLGQGPCFSKITYMVTACRYSEGMYSTVVYCAFFWWITWVQSQPLTSFFISEIIQYLVRNLTDCYENLWDMSSPYLLL